MFPICYVWSERGRDRDRRKVTGREKIERRTGTGEEAATDRSPEIEAKGGRGKGVRARGEEAEEEKELEIARGGGKKGGRRGEGRAAGGRSELQSSASSRGPEVNNVTAHLLHRQDGSHTCSCT